MKLLLTATLLWLLGGVDPSRAAAMLDLPRAESVPGGIVILNLHREEKPLYAVWLKRRVMLVQRRGRWFAIIGIPLSLRPGRYELIVRYGNRSMSPVPFIIRNRHYRTQRITLTNQRMVTPDNRDLQRIYREKNLIITALSRWSDPPEIGFDFHLPVRGHYRNSFGFRRIFNGKPRQPHRGMDISAPRGTPVRAPADGVVVMTGDFFFTGKTVFIDHGRGLVSMYAHLDRILVRARQPVNQDEQIGTVGMTGRATGPHLHWAISLNRTMVNPALFLRHHSHPEKQHKIRRK